MAERIAKMFPTENQKTKFYENNNISVLHSNTILAYFQDALNDDVEPQKAILLSAANKNAARKIYAPIKVTTVYQLLNIFFGRKFFEVGLLELTNSIIIFDEIHAYDGHTLGLILVMLKYLNKLNARIFIMTATLPHELKEQLREAACIRSTQEIALKHTYPLCTEERRKLQAIDSLIEDNIDYIRQTIEFSRGEKKKVVIVCNTVSKAIKIWDALKNYNPLLIHSRFTLGDRSKRECKGNLEKVSIVISTQVIEVSIDVSFDIMFTELAPADSLLQRFGRINRHGKIDPNNLGMCYVYTAEDQGSKIIYDSEILKLTKNYLPKEPLCFISACDWIEKVYPSGLSERQNEKKANAQSNFESLVAQLRPMIDPPIDINLEESLMSTVEVIPFIHEKKWKEYKTNGEHLLARQLIVNVSYPSWCGAKQNYKNQFDTDGFRLDRITDEYKEYIIALFEYDSKTGLRLDKPIPPSEDISNRVL
jgi:CRISPR-associated endonuclease/helicase Cas3